MNPDNFIVRSHLKAVVRFQDKKPWQALGESDVHELEDEVAGLPNERETDELEARRFDLLALRMQLAHVEGNAGAFEIDRHKVAEMAGALEEKDSIPAVKAQLDFIRLIQTSEYWEAIDLAKLENLRVRLRGLAQFVEKNKRPIVYTGFEDEIISVREDAPIEIPSMTGAQYAKKVKAYLDEHKDAAVILRLRQNEPLTVTDLTGLESTLVELGNDDGVILLKSLLEKNKAPSLAHFVRGMVGMDRAAAKSAFAGFLEDQTLNERQIRFVEMIIDQLTARGVMEASALYEAPFISLDTGGMESLFAGHDNIIDGLVAALEKTAPSVFEEIA
jgi:type I restriction enzyme R subunit